MLCISSIPIYHFVNASIQFLQYWYRISSLLVSNFVNISIWFQNVCDGTFLVNTSIWFPQYGIQFRQYLYIISSIPANVHFQIFGQVWGRNIQLTVYVRITYDKKCFFIVLFSQKTVWLLDFRLLGHKRHLPKVVEQPTEEGGATHRRCASPPCLFIIYVKWHNLDVLPLMIWPGYLLKVTFWTWMIADVSLKEKKAS